MTDEVAIEGLSTAQVARLTGLHAKTIRELNSRGVLAANRDRQNRRVFHPNVVPFLKKFYRSVPPPQRPSPMMTFLDSLTDEELVQAFAASAASAGKALAPDASDAVEDFEVVKAERRPGAAVDNEGGDAT